LIADPQASRHRARPVRTVVHTSIVKSTTAERVDAWLDAATRRPRNRPALDAMQRVGMIGTVDNETAAGGCVVALVTDEASERNFSALSRPVRSRRDSGTRLDIDILTAESPVDRRPRIRDVGLRRSRAHREGLWGNVHTSSARGSIWTSGRCLFDLEATPAGFKPTIRVGEHTRGNPARPRLPRDAAMSSSAPARSAFAKSDSHSELRANGRASSDRSPHHCISRRVSTARASEPG